MKYSEVAVIKNSYNSSMNFIKKKKEFSLINDVVLVKIYMYLHDKPFSLRVPIKN